jgi:hypothetical protein
MTKQLHLAAQYLATAAKSFLEAKSDDSHTNLGFSIKEKSLQTWDLDDKGTKLCLNYEQFSLKWSQTDKSYALDGKTHEETIKWLSDTSKSLGFEKPYQFDLHYDMPYMMGPNDRFKKSDTQELILLRTLAQTSLKSFLDVENLTSDIRIWPHHFDTGAFCVLNDGSGKSVGMGLSIPDSMIDDHYFYISGYLGHDGLDTSTFDTLTNGKWLNDGFKGGILPASGVSNEIAVQFFREAFEAYRS